VAGDTLVTAAECDGEELISGEVTVIENEPFEAQPLFARDLRGGRWRVLRWLPGDTPPLLAAEDNRIAIGLQFTTTKMEVSLVDVGSGRTQAHFGVPDGYLSFASPQRLLLSTPSWERELGQFPLAPQPRPSAFPYSRLGAKGYSLSLYSTKGKRIASVGSTQEAPLVSDMHLVTVGGGEEASSLEGASGSVIVLRGLRSGQTRQVIGFNPPGRELIALAFRWPALVVVESTSAPLRQSEVTCSSGEYQPSSGPFLATFDLAFPEAFVPAPPSPHLEQPPPSLCRRGAVSHTPRVLATSAPLVVPET
jgi:hypothetical protein